MIRISQTHHPALSLPEAAMLPAGEESAKQVDKTFFSNLDTAASSHPRGRRAGKALLKAAGISLPGIQGRRLSNQKYIGGHPQTVVASDR